MQRASSRWSISVAVLAVIVIIVTGCSPAAQPVAQPAQTELGGAGPAAAAPASQAAAGGAVVNRAGVTLPADAAPLDKQVLRMATQELKWLTWDASVYDENVGDMFAWADSCVRPDKNFVPQPNACVSWETTSDGLTWTFHLQQDKKWSDDQPITADDWVFTLQRYARPDYDFEWFYGMANIVNWDDVRDGKKPPEELGAKKVDDYTFSVTTSRPTPYLIKIFADLWVVPKHIVKDRLDDGSWAFDKNNWVFAGPYKLQSWDKGKQLVFVANDKYTGPHPPMVDEIIYSFMDTKVTYAAYKNDELDAIGGDYQADLPPAALAEIMADPVKKKELITWPNFMTYYLFFDTWNKPFDNLKVRQAFSHAIDRDKLINGPLKYQGVAAYSMNPPGFPGANINGLKGIQNYDPQLAAQLLADAGFPGGKDFPKLTMYLRHADPALQNAAEAIGGMLKESLGITVEIQNIDYTLYMEKLSKQKKDKGGDFIFALVPYEFDFVDGSNMLSPWGGCESEGVTDLSQQPGRHTWYNADFNQLLCDAGVIVGDEAKRDQLYQQAEKILISDVALVPIYHPTMVAMVKPDLKGPMFAPDQNGVVSWNRFRFTSREAEVYHSTGSR